jgi:AsmA protein
MLTRSAKWIGVTLLVVVSLILVVLNLSNWNWLRSPLSRAVADKTGRELVIGGDLVVDLGWPTTHVRTSNVSFSNPTWAEQANMLAVRNIVFTLDMPPLLKRAIVLSEVQLDAANLDLEKSKDGRKNWLLDKAQRDEKSRIQINSLTLREGKLTYKDPGQKTDIKVEVSTPPTSTNPATALEFNAQGRFKGHALNAKGKGGSVLTLRDKQTPYPLNVTGTIGPTFVHAEGRITTLLQFSAIDLAIGG